MDGASTVAIDLLAAQYRTRQSLLPRLTGLFMVVPTVHCNHSCTYCQVTRRSESSDQGDMTPEIADKTVEFILSAPSSEIKIEFQGGEPLLRFDLVQHIVEQVKRCNRNKKRVDFVLASNLSLLDDRVLGYCRANDIFLSTSLDGPRELHNANRLLADSGSYDIVVANVRRAMDVLGPDRVSALMTTTRLSLSQPRDIVDEYIRNGFRSIFIRRLNPYGKAATYNPALSYSVDEWFTFYREVLDYIIRINLDGFAFREEFAALLLRRILTPFPTGFVDLQSPPGLGIAGILVNRDGGVYPSDEARMLAEMGDETFRMGNVLSDSYSDLLLSENLLEWISETMTEGMPECCDCGLQPYCGSDPVRHYRTQGDMVGFKPTSEFCREMKRVMLHLISLLEDDPMSRRVLEGWAWAG
jgi:His-Xaa-Ser system radical SAM maturase HxsB